MSVYIVGLGMGNYGTLTGEAKEAILGAESYRGRTPAGSAAGGLLRQVFCGSRSVEIIRLIEMNARPINVFC